MATCRYFTLSNLVADVFVLYAIVYIMYTNGRSLAVNGIVEPLEGFNTSDYSIFLGTAVFVFEGIGLIIPTQAALATNLQPQFPALLAKTIAGCVVFFSLFASVNYAAIGNAVQPMILSSLPRTPQTMAVQAGYAFAQTLAYPLFLFPALQIVEDVLGFQRRSSGLKVQKNVVRTLVVLSTVAIAYAGQAHLDLFVSLVGAFCCGIMTTWPMTRVSVVPCSAPRIHLPAMVLSQARTRATLGFQGPRLRHDRSRSLYLLLRDVDQRRAMVPRVCLRKMRKTVSPSSSSVLYSL